MQYVETVSILREIPLFANLDPAIQKRLAFSSDFLTFDVGERLFLEGDISDSVHVILDGEVEIVRESHEEGCVKEVIIGRLRRHQVAGEMGVILNAARSATIRAASTVKVLCIDAETFLRVVTEHPETALILMRMQSEKLTRLTEAYDDLERRWMMRPGGPCAPAGSGPVPERQ